MLTTAAFSYFFSMVFFFILLHSTLFVHMWNIRLKLTDTDSSTVVTRGEGLGDSKGKGDQICGDRR